MNATATAAAEPAAKATSLLDDPQLQAAAGTPRRHKLHWPQWERSMLLELTAMGNSPAELARRLDRSEAGVVEMIERLLRGEAECPADAADTLKDLRAARDAAAPPAKPPALGSEASLVYRDLTRRIETLEVRLAGLSSSLSQLAEATRAITDLLELCLALQRATWAAIIAEDEAAARDLIALDVPQAEALRIHQLAGNLRLAYEGRSKLAAATPAAAQAQAQAPKSEAVDDSAECASGGGPRWQDKPLAGLLAGQPAIVEALSSLKPPILTVGQWDELVESGRPGPLGEGQRVLVERAVDAFKRGGVDRTV
jgi:hypothetical protein